MELKDDLSSDNNNNNKVGQLTYHVEYCPQKNDLECKQSTTNSTYLSISKQVEADSLYKFTVIPINGYGMRGEAHTSYQIIPKSKSQRKKCICKTIGVMLKWVYLCLKQYNLRPKIFPDLKNYTYQDIYFDI